ncbi:hypothetical protein LWI29_012839 [Acer saccharum]|uniref:Uncharacterized protein n=1 Tax=Acer saccharum TaxID=4024 RepID=A0AA39VGG9_ACESA|nr:hypothetical protein LWI29_012839 [Acer saccharum]
MFEEAFQAKVDDPGSFVIPISVGGSELLKEMLDLGASINMMPLALYEKLGLVGLEPTRKKLMLVDRTTRAPHGEIKDIPILVDGIVVPTDFMVLNIEEKSNGVATLQVLLATIEKLATQVGELAEIVIEEEGEECSDHNDQEETEEPPKLHKSTNPFFCLTVNGLKPVKSIESSKCDLDEVLLEFEEELKVKKEWISQILEVDSLELEEGLTTKKMEELSKEVDEPVESSNSSEYDLGEVLLKFEEELRLEKEGKEVDLVKENAELLSLNVDYILKIDLTEKERDSSLKELEDIKEDFARRMRLMEA